MLVGLFTPTASGRPRPLAEDPTLQPLNPTKCSDTYFDYIVSFIYPRDELQVAPLQPILDLEPHTPIMYTVTNNALFAAPEPAAEHIYRESISSEIEKHATTSMLAPQILLPVVDHILDTYSIASVATRVAYHRYMDECYAVKEEYTYQITVVNDQDIPGFNLTCAASDLTLLNSTVNVQITTNDIDPYFISVYIPSVHSVEISGRHAIVYTNTTIPDNIIYQTRFARFVYRHVTSRLPSMPTQWIEYYWLPINLLTHRMLLQLIGLAAALIAITTVLAVQLIFNTRYFDQTLWERIRYKIATWWEPMLIPHLKSPFLASMDADSVIADQDGFDEKQHAYNINSKAAARDFADALAAWELSVKEITKANKDGLKAYKAAAKEHGSKIDALRSQLADMHKSKRDVNKQLKSKKAALRVASTSQGIHFDSITTTSAQGILEDQAKEISADINRMQSEIEDEGPIPFIPTPLPEKPVLQHVEPPTPILDYKMVAYGHDVVGATVAYLRRLHQGPVPTDVATRAAANRLAANFIDQELSTKLSMQARAALVAEAMYTATFVAHEDLVAETRLASWAVQHRLALHKRAVDRRTSKH